MLKNKCIGNVKDVSHGCHGYTLTNFTGTSFVCPELEVLPEETPCILWDHIQLTWSACNVVFTQYSGECTIDDDGRTSCTSKCVSEGLTMCLCDGEFIHHFTLRSLPAKCSMTMLGYWCNNGYSIAEYFCAQIFQDFMNYICRNYEIFSSQNIPYSILKELNTAKPKDTVFPEHNL